MVTLLMRIRRTRDRSEPKVAARDIRALFAGIAAADSIDFLRGCEGRGSAIYFGALRWGLQQDQGFARRVRRPHRPGERRALSSLHLSLQPGLCRHPPGQS